MTIQGDDPQPIRYVAVIYPRDHGLPHYRKYWLACWLATTIGPLLMAVLPRGATVQFGITSNGRFRWVEVKFRG